MSHGAGNRHVFQLGSQFDTAQHQPSAAHVAAADECGREQEPIAEDWQQQIDVLSGSDAAKQDNTAIRTDRGGHGLCSSFERLPVAWILQIDDATGKPPERLQCDAGVWRPQPGIGRDDQYSAARKRVRRIAGRGKAARVRELSSKVQAADKAERVAEERAAATL